MYVARNSLRTFRNGFTLIEILVVITIIAVLASILLPAISRMRSAAMGVQCESNIHDLMHGVLAFAADHDARLPGNLNGSYDGAYQHSDWLFGQGGFSTTPQAGTVYPYVGSKKAYLCPSLELYSVGDEAQSNGRFDYAMFTLFGGARISHVPLRCQLTLLNGGLGSYPTPVICQEDPYQFNGANIEGDHGNVDQLAHVHGGGSFYGSIDGSTTWVIEPDVENQWTNGAWQWSCMTPLSHQMFPLGSGYGGWGWWDQQ